MALAAPTTLNIAGSGALRVRFETTEGNLAGLLFEDKAPRTVANFVGLATGTCAWADPKTREEVKRPFFDGLPFHRVIPDFMIQGGCPLGTGTGHPGYRFADEFHASLKHDRGGLLSMANSGPNTNGSQFFITEVATPWLDGKHAIFGEITEAKELIAQIARKQGKTTINKVVIWRG